jgi:phage repressor protein C with HTH and peptisase S24 domain
MDATRTMLVELAARTGASLSALSRMIGRNPAYLQQYVRRGSPRVLPEEERRRLAGFFGVGEGELGGVAGMTPVALRVPRLDVAASAGPGSLVDDEVMLGADAIDPALMRRLALKGEAAIIRVRGDSMEPGLLEGDQILVDTGDRVPNARGGVFVIRIEEAVMVKRVALRDGRLTVRSDNPAAAPVPAGEAQVIGRVVWLMRVPR